MVRRNLIGRRWEAALLCIGLMTACRGESPASKQATSVKESVPATRVPSAPLATVPGKSSSTPGDTACPTWGDWQPCSVEYRLARAGLLLTKADAPVRHAFMHVPGVGYDVGNAQIEVFLYPNAQERARDTDQLDSETVSPRGQPQIWREPPTLVVSNNLAAIILSVNARQAERIALALEAGQSPNPPPKR
jgi:hypothetical protein